MNAVVDLTVDTIDRSEVLRYLGYRGQQIDATINRQVDDAVVRISELARPRVALRSFTVAEYAHDTQNNRQPYVSLAGSALVLTGQSITRHLAHAHSVGVMAVTLGMGIDRELQRLSLAGDTLAQVFFDAAATAAVEHAADSAEAILVAQAAQRGLCVTERFSPGYGDLPLSCQRTLLESIDATRRLGITLTPSNLLVPTKSVTAVVGIGKQVVRQHGERCSACSLRTHCTVRKTGTTCYRS